MIKRISMIFSNNPAMGFFVKFMKRLNEPDQIVAAMLVCFGMIVVILSLILGYYKGLALTGAIIFGALFYLLFRNKLAKTVPASLFQLGKQIRPISYVVFIISLFLMIFIMWSNLYIRPPIFFFIFLIAVFSIVLDIFSLDETKKSHISIALFKIIILSITVYSSVYHDFPGIWGVDAWWHNEWTRETINLGHITTSVHGSNDYFLFPLFHIWGAITQMVTQVSIYNAVFLGTGVMIALSSIFAFLIGEKLVNVKVGLIAALVFPLTDQAISRSTNIIAMSLAFCFFPAILYLILGRDEKRVSDTLLVILFSTALILTHTIAALVTLLSLSVIYVSHRLIKKIGKLTVTYKSVPLTLIAFFGLLMLFKWMQPPPETKPFFDANLNSFIQTLQSEAQFVMTGASPTRAIAPAVTVLDDGGYILLLVCGIIGALTFLHRSNRAGLTLALISLTAFLVVVPQMLDVFGVTNLLPDRWFMFSYVVLTVVAATGFLRIASIIPWKNGKIGVILLITLATTFMMATDSNANADSPMVFNGSQRTGYTQSELDVIGTLCDIGGGRPITDAYFGRTFPYVVGFDRYEYLLQENSRVFIKRNYYLGHPEWDKYYVAGMMRAGPEVVYSSRDLISEYIYIWGIDDWPVIYRNNNVTIFSDASLLAQNR